MSAFSRFRLLAALVLLALAQSAQARSVLLVSIDGLRPADVLAPSGRAPGLRALAASGAWSDKVRATLPALTYPAHTTLITGASPARHGIGGNEAFDPLRRNQEGWMWYAADIRADTLWAAAHRRGLKTAAINWPVTVAAPIDWNLPQYWRSGAAEDGKLVAALATPGLVQWLQGRSGLPLPGSRDASTAADQARANYAAALLRYRRPAFLAVHLEALDHVSHDHGPGSPEALAALPEVDRVVSALVTQAREFDPATVVVVVSDHGFVPVSHAVNLDAALRDAGLQTADSDGTVVDWQAAIWPMSGSAAVILRQPGDPALEARVGTVLDSLAADPSSGVVRIMRRNEIGAAGGAGEASFWVVFRPGFVTGGSPAGPFHQVAWLKGSHGNSPETPGMEALLIIAGAGIARDQALGPIDMRTIAPTIAKLLDARLINAEMPALSIERR